MTTIVTEYDDQQWPSHWVYHNSFRVGCLFHTDDMREWSLFFCGGLYSVAKQLQILSAVAEVLAKGPINPTRSK